MSARIGHIWQMPTSSIRLAVCQCTCSTPWAARLPKIAATVRLKNLKPGHDVLHVAIKQGNGCKMIRDHQCGLLVKLDSENQTKHNQTGLWVFVRSEDRRLEHCIKMHKDDPGQRQCDLMDYTEIAASLCKLRSSNVPAAGTKCTRQDCDKDKQRLWWLWSKIIDVRCGATEHQPVKCKVWIVQWWSK